MFNNFFNANSGYYGHSRSVRSQDAIDGFEVPLAMMTSELISRFLSTYSDSWSPEELKFLRDQKITTWKYIARFKIHASSWHHTGKFFAETDHYDLDEVAHYILTCDMEKLLEDKKNQVQYELEEKAEEIRNYEYGIIEKLQWGGTVKKPKVIGTNIFYGLVFGNWLYDTNDVRHNIRGNSIVKLTLYDSYKDFVKSNPQYKKQVKLFNKIMSKKTNGKFKRTR